MPGVERVGASMGSRPNHVQSNFRLDRYKLCIVMEFRHRRYFLALAEELHFGRAARRLANTQPPLSLNIQQLEASVGARLFVRDSQGVRLTAAGTAIRRSAQALLHRDAFMACLPAAHALARRRRDSLLQLREEPFVLFSRRAAPDYYSRIVDLCGALGFYPNVRHEVRHWLSVVSLVSRGMGVSVVPAPLERAGMAGVVFRPLLQDTPPSEVYCAWKQGNDHPARQRFLQQMLAGR